MYCCMQLMRFISKINLTHIICIIYILIDIFNIEKQIKFHIKQKKNTNEQAKTPYIKYGYKT